MYLHTWSLVVGGVWQGCGTFRRWIFLEEVLKWRGGGAFWGFRAWLHFLFSLSASSMQKKCDESRPWHIIPACCPAFPALMDWLYPSRSISHVKPFEKSAFCPRTLSQQWEIIKTHVHYKKQNSKSAKTPPSKLIQLVVYFWFHSAHCTLDNWNNMILCPMLWISTHSKHSSCALRAKIQYTSKSSAFVTLMYDQGHMLFDFLCLTLCV